MDFIHSFKAWLHTNDHEVEIQNIDKHNIKNRKTERNKEQGMNPPLSGVFFLKDQQCP